MSHRKIRALRNLAERPGTEHEGRVAREMLKRFEAKRSDADYLYDRFRDFLRTGSMDDLAEAVGDSVCDCGNRYPPFVAGRGPSKCQREDVHSSLRIQITQRFRRGARVYYNRWAYAANCPGTVVGYSKDWNWVRIKFDHLKNVRSVPVYSAAGWHLSIVPLDAETRARLRGGMENMETAPPAKRATESNR